MASKQQTVASFVETAPPGELSNVVADIKALAPSEVQSLEPAYRKYNEDQYIIVKLPSGDQTAILSQYNSSGNGRYFDTASETSFEVDHAAQKASNSQSQPIDSPNADLVRSLQQAFKTASAEHFPSSTIGIYPTSNTITLVLVANKYSPQNFWNGRWRSTYTFDPSSSSLSGNVKIDVHYYEDGNVRMNTTKKVEVGNVSGGAEAVVKEIAKAENKFQEELNRAFTTLAEGSFKGLRRQLPVTRQRMEWEKHQGYRLGQDIGGGRSK
ncbi:F-actin-capping protein subunit alpha [Hortaea werneckii]|nr:F-actin-capping protein subunit alpha [Hortaea werneckii]